MPLKLAANKQIKQATLVKASSIFCKKLLGLQVTVLTREARRIPTKYNLRQELQVIGFTQETSIIPKKQRQETSDERSVKLQVIGFTQVTSIIRNNRFL